jgi:hypothetical protein
MMKLISLLFCLFLFCCGGDGSNHPPNPSPIPVCEFTYSDGECQPDNTQIRTVTSKQPEGCEGEPVLIQPCTYVPPEPTDCCPKGDSILICKNYLTESPYLTVQCNQKGYWYLTVKDANTVVPLWVKLPLPDLSCCPIEKTGLLPEQCTAMKPCYAYYAQPTDWVLFSKMEGWYIGNIRTYESYKVIN